MSHATATESPLTGPNVIDGSRRAQARRAAAEVPGLDFPLPGGRTARLPYPAVRYRPVGPMAPADPTRGLPARCEVEARVGYPAAVDVVVRRFHEIAADPDASDRAVFAAAVVVAWTMILRLDPLIPPLEPAELFDLPAEEAAVFAMRVLLLTYGMPDLERDESGAYLIPTPAEDLAGPVADEPPIPTDEVPDVR